MSILLALLYLALIILVVGLGYYVVTWALGIVGIVIPPRAIQWQLYTSLIKSSEV